MKMKLGMIAGAFGIVGALTACKSTPKRPTPPPAPKIITKPIPPPKDYQPAKPTALTDLGNNFHPRFSPDGQHLIFDSRNRRFHQQSQIYELNLTTFHARRLTYQDGDATDPAYDPSGKNFIYASTTDEIKEDPTLIKMILEKYGANATKSSSSPTKPASDHSFTSFQWLAQELYLSRIDGSDIKRLTKSPGFDGKPCFHPLLKEIAFASKRSHTSEIYLLKGRSNRAKMISHEKTNATDPQFSPDGKKLAWIVLSQDEKTSSIAIADAKGRNASTLSLPSGLYRDVAWSPDGKYLLTSSDFQEASNEEIYVYDFSQKCLKRLTYFEGRDRNPSFSPDGKKIAFSSNRSGQFELYLMDFNLPKSCVP